MPDTLTDVLAALARRSRRTRLTCLLCQRRRANVPQVCLAAAQDGAAAPGCVSARCRA
jgi:hypothetical protein